MKAPAPPALSKTELVAVAATKWADVWHAFNCIVIVDTPAASRIESDAMLAQAELATERLLEAVAELDS